MKTYLIQLESKSCTVKDLIEPMVQFCDDTGKPATYSLSASCRYSPIFLILSRNGEWRSVKNSSHNYTFVSVYQDLYVVMIVIATFTLPATLNMKVTHAIYLV